jgi:hypothetical protein
VPEVPEVPEIVAVARMVVALVVPMGIEDRTVDWLPVDSGLTASFAMQAVVAIAVVGYSAMPATFVPQHSAAVASAMTAIAAKPTEIVAR